MALQVRLLRVYGQRRRTTAATYEEMESWKTLLNIHRFHLILMYPYCQVMPDSAPSDRGQAPGLKLLDLSRPAAPHTHPRLFMSRNMVGSLPTLFIVAFSHCFLLVSPPTTKHTRHALQSISAISARQSFSCIGGH